MKNRTERINAELQREISAIINRELRHPLLTEMVSIVRVACTPDLKYAKVYVSVFSKDAKKAEDTFGAIVESAATIRHALARRMTVRTVPSLTFISDDSMAYSMHISAMLKDLLPEDGGDKPDGE